MITVKTANNYTDKIEKGEDFEVAANGALLVKENRYDNKAIRAYAPGAWVDVVIQQDPKPVDTLDIDKLHELLLPGEPLYVLPYQFAELKRRVLLDYTDKNGVITWDWQGHNLFTCNSLYEQELVHRSRVKAVEAKAEVK